MKRFSFSAKIYAIDGNFLCQLTDACSFSEAFVQKHSDTKGHFSFIIDIKNHTSPARPVDTWGEQRVFKKSKSFPRPMAHRAVPISVSITLDHASANAVKATAEGWSSGSSACFPPIILQGCI